MFILCITSDFEVLVKFCHGLLKIIANVRTIYSAYKTYTKVQLTSMYLLVKVSIELMNDEIDVFGYSVPFLQKYKEISKISSKSDT